MNTLDKIASAHYVANDAQIEALAREQYTATAQVGVANATYLRVLVVGCQAELGSRRGRAAPFRPDAQLAVLEKTHERYYAAVLRGVTTDDVSPEENLERTEKGRRMLERNRRSAFARSATTTLRNYVRAGGDLRALEPETTTKTGLQQFVSSKAAPDTDKLGARVARAEKSLLAALKRMAKEDPDRAAEAMEAITERLQVALSELGPSEQVVAGTQAAATPTGKHARTRVGVPFMRLPQGGSP